MGQWSKPHSLKKPLVVTRQTGEKNGTKRHLLVDDRGVPLSIVVTGANRHDVSQLGAVLEAIIVERPDTVQHLCADKGYSGEPAQQIIKDRLYIPHVKQRGEEIQEKKINPTYKARRYVVEVTHSWFNRFRRLLSDHTSEPLPKKSINLTGRKRVLKEGSVSAGRLFHRYQKVE